MRVDKKARGSVLRFVGVDGLAGGHPGGPGDGLLAAPGPRSRAISRVGWRCDRSAARRDLLRDRARAPAWRRAVTRLVKVRYLTASPVPTARCCCGRTRPGGRTCCARTGATHQVGRQRRTSSAGRAGRRRRWPPGEGRATRLRVARRDLDLHAALVEQAAGAELVSVEQAVEALRAVKDDARSRTAAGGCAIADLADGRADRRGGLRRGRTEREVGRDLDAGCRARRGRPVVETIVAAGRTPRLSAPPAGGPGAGAWRLVQLDFGANPRRLPLRNDPHAGARHAGGVAARGVRPGPEAQRAGREALAPAPTSARSTRLPARSSPPAATARRSRTASATASAGDPRGAVAEPAGAGTLAIGWPSPSSQGLSPRRGGVGSRTR